MHPALRILLILTAAIAASIAATCAKSGPSVTPAPTHSAHVLSRGITLPSGGGLG